MELIHIILKLLLRHIIDASIFITSTATEGSSAHSAAALKEHLESAIAVARPLHLTKVARILSTATHSKKGFILNNLATGHGLLQGPNLLSTAIPLLDVLKGIVFPLSPHRSLLIDILLHQLSR